MEDPKVRHIPWALFVSEFVGTALLVLVGDDRLFRRMAMPWSPISARNGRETES
jgi:hypothetical protein